MISPRFKKVKDFIVKRWPKNKSHRIVLSMLIFTTLWFFTGFFHFSWKKEEKPTQTLTAVRVKDLVSKHKTPFVKLAGFTQEKRSVKIRAETDGQVTEIAFKKGSSVKKNDLLVRLSLDTRRAKFSEAKALVDQRKLEYEVALRLEQKSLRSKTNVADSKAKYEAAMATLNEIETSIKDTKIISPFEGVLNERFVEVGSYVKVGDEVLEIMDLNPLRIIFYVSENDLASVKVDKIVKVHLSGRSFEGKVTYKSMMADPETRTFRVEAEIENREPFFPSGLTAEVQMPLEQRKAQLISAALLILNDQGVLGVHTVNQKNKVDFYPIHIISHDGRFVWVTGLPDKIRLITVGQEFVSPGQEVTAVSEEKGEEDVQPD